MLQNDLALVSAEAKESQDKVNTFYRWVIFPLSVT